MLLVEVGYILALYVYGFKCANCWLDKQFNRAAVFTPRGGLAIFQNMLLEKPITKRCNRWGASVLTNFLCWIIALGN